MSSDVTTSFLTYYIRSLAERTRVEKTSTKLGFDWIIYNLCLAEDLIPHRLPFIRGGANEISKTKTEPEFGIDYSFFSPDRRVLTIFVLKDEVLCNANWDANNFRSDLWKASAPDLTPPEFENVEEVRIILAYNKDEDQTGIQLYSNLIASRGTKVGDKTGLSFERWNLTTITEKTKTKLLTPSLLPQRFFSLFNYICSQFADFRHGSEEWTEQLIPNWRRFLSDVLSDNADERSVRLLPVALLILRQQGSANPTGETGWIDLLEWAMLAAWKASRISQNERIKTAVLQMWTGFYLRELELYYTAHAADLSVEHGLEARGAGGPLDAIAAAVVSLWHVARLGLLAIGYAEFLSRGGEDDQRERARVLNVIANWMVSFLNAHPSAKRPLLDIHHIEMFLIWRTLWQVGRKGDIYIWLQELERRLLVRRAGTASLPFVEGGNSLELVFEFVATGQKPPEFCDQSSLLLLMLIELCFSVEPARRNDLILRYYRELVLGQDSFGGQMEKCASIDLMGWAPSANWPDEILTRNIADGGQAQILETFKVPTIADGADIAARIEDFVRQCRSAQKFEFPEGLPVSVAVLACLKHSSPLPPEFWRQSIFREIQSQSAGP